MIVTMMAELSLTHVNAPPATHKTHLGCKGCVFSTEVEAEIAVIGEA